MYAAISKRKLNEITIRNNHKIRRREWRKWKPCFQSMTCINDSIFAHLPLGYNKGDGIYHATN